MSLAATDAAHEGIHNGNDNAGTMATSSHPITPVDTLVGGSGAGSGVCARVDNAIMQGCVNAKGKQVFVSKGPGVARSMADGLVALPPRKWVKNQASRVSGSGKRSHATTTS
ncbi:hypothetical protein Peur_008563 [Populus x canadensis]